MIDSCYLGDVRDGLRAITAAGIRPRTCVTSPPYWGLRDYGVDGQMGLEPTPAEFVERMVEVFRLVRDVLADDGTLWLNMGDSYATGAGRVGNAPGGWGKGEKWRGGHEGKHGQVGPMTQLNRMPLEGLKPKDLIGIPWRVAFALQADGWYLRQDIIWSKPSPMPESVRDRCTKAHEYLFLLSKQARYYYDTDAIAESRASVGDSFVNGWAIGSGAHTAIAHARDKGDARSFRGGGKYTNGQSRTAEPVERDTHGNQPANKETRNRRSVWTIPSEPFPGAHFATFPTALVEPCILAGSAPGDVVLDPFLGSGTVAQVAQNLGRHWIGCELNPEYHKMIHRRTAQAGMVLA